MPVFLLACSRLALQPAATGWPLWWPASLSYIQLLPHLFTSISSPSLMPDLLVAVYDNWVPSTLASLHHKAGDVGAHVVLGGDVSASCLQPLLRCYVDQSEKTKTWGAQINCRVKRWREAEWGIACSVLPAWHGTKLEKLTLWTLISESDRDRTVRTKNYPDPCTSWAHWVQSALIEQLYFELCSSPQVKIVKFLELQ